MKKEKTEFQSYQKYKVEAIYQRSGSKKVFTYDVQTMEQVKYIVDIFKNEVRNYGDRLEEIKVSIVLGWQETFWKSHKPLNVADIDKDIENLPDILRHFKPTEKRWETADEIRNRILDDARDMVDMDYVRKVNESLGD